MWGPQLLALPPTNINKCIKYKHEAQFLNVFNPRIQRFDSKHTNDFPERHVINIHAKNVETCVIINLHKLILIGLVQYYIEKYFWNQGFCPLCLQGMETIILLLPNKHWHFTAVWPLYLLLYICNNSKSRWSCISYDFRVATVSQFVETFYTHYIIPQGIYFHDTYESTRVELLDLSINCWGDSRVSCRGKFVGKTVHVSIISLYVSSQSWEWNGTRKASSCQSCGPQPLIARRQRGPSYFTTLRSKSSKLLKAANVNLISILQSKHGAPALFFFYLIEQ